MNINDLCKKAHENAVSKGFWEEERSFAEQIALMHSELSEALEEYRDGNDLAEVYYKCGTPRIGECNEDCEKPICYKPEGIPIELADVLIRIFDTAAHYEIDLEKAIEIKMKYNEGRPHKHGKVI